MKYRSYYPPEPVEIPKYVDVASLDTNRRWTILLELLIILKQLASLNKLKLQNDAVIVELESGVNQSYDTLFIILEKLEKQLGSRFLMEKLADNKIKLKKLKNF